MANRRVARPRSRNGCITCKLRHVKCDEEKPECLQCQRSGRKCDGYDTASQTQLRQRIAERHRPLDRAVFGADHRLLLRQESRTERRYIDFFYARTSPAFSGFYDSKLWSYLIPQLGEHEPSIRHAMTAIGAIHARLQSPKCLPSSEESSATTENFVLEEYNKSIQGLVKSLTCSGAESIELTLTTCCLFVCLEILRGFKNEALNHIEAGLRIIVKHENSPGYTGQESELYAELRDLFTRLNLQASFMGRLLIPLKNHSADTFRPGTPFTSLVQARSHLDQVMTKGLLFIRSIGIMRERRDTDELLALKAEQQEIRCDLVSWRWSFDRLLEKIGSQLNPSETCASLLLPIYFHTCLIWLLTVLGRTEDLFDDFIPDFEALVSSAEEIVRIGSPTYHASPPENQSGDSTFTLEGEIIAPLYFAACRCRDPLIRRRAINILLHYSKREGMWDARLYAAVANLVCEVEESQCLEQPMCATDIGSLARVYEAVQPKDFLRNPALVILWTRPGGVDGTWKMRSVLVDW
ncbi:Zn(II)2Cys6 transcription factor [Aspergillus lucknowensis]|uniref:Zn(2)-C6 fungal-type domain-containing protein n=1 Tax=Aspergillus lucknowensis TaxID=176173 RepID=A0ABR4L5G8_9EURO